MKAPRTELFQSISTAVSRWLTPQAKPLPAIKKELIGRPYAEFFINTDFDSPVLDTLERGIDHVALEVKYPGKDRTIQISVSTSQLRNAQGETVGALVIFTDLTAAKEVQRRIEQAERLATLGELMAGWLTKCEIR